MTCVCSVWVPVVVVGAGLGPVHTQLSPLRNGEVGSRQAIRSSRDLFLKYTLNSEHIPARHTCAHAGMYTHTHAPVLPLGIKYGEGLVSSASLCA